MAEQFKNLASTTLNGDIDDTTTSVVVAIARWASAAATSAS